jgi:signal transduction histidine kinase
MDTPKPSPETARHYERRHPPIDLGAVGVGVLILAGLAASAFHDRTLFLWLAELLNILVALSIFGIAWNARRLIDNNFFLIIGMAFLAVAVLDLAHVLSHEKLAALVGHGMGFPGQLRIEARLIEAFSLCLAPFAIGRRQRPSVFLGFYIALAAIALGVASAGLLPPCHLPGGAQSRFQWWSEITVLLCLFLALIPLRAKHKNFDRHTLGLIVAAIIAAAASEFRFLFTPESSTAVDIFGHLLKTLSSLIFYKAIVSTGFTRPYEILFHNLKRSEEHMRGAHAQLEEKVRERTSDLSQANLELRREMTGRRRLERQILEISESEQHRIGRDLHDGLGQHLTGIALKAELLAQILDSQSSSEAHSARDIEEMVSQAISQTRRLVKGLSPRVSTPEDLHLALKDLAASTREVFSVECRFHADSLVHLGRPRDAIHIYRIAQEAVHNALKHGKAMKITISLSECDGVASLTVLDDGAGFAAPPEDHQGMGLSVMHYRAHVINGTCEVRADVEGGTIVACSFPVPTAHESRQQEGASHA